MNRSALDAGDQGPVWLGYRLGHLKNDGRVFRSVIYNKGAMVLHMLRRVVGDEVFTRGLQRFYGESRFRRVGTDDLRAAFELESGRSLERFFERWIYEADVPTLRTSWRVDDPDLSSAGALGGADASRVVRVRVEQSGDRLFVLPLTVTIVYVDGRTERALVQVDGATTDLAVPVTSAVRDVRFNDDFAALARIERARR
jgi:aminopeptidase N